MESMRESKEARWAAGLYDGRRETLEHVQWQANSTQAQQHAPCRRWPQRVVETISMIYMASRSTFFGLQHLSAFPP